MKSYMTLCFLLVFGVPSIPAPGNRPGGCNGVVYEDYCYWTAKQGNAPLADCTDGELAVVSNNQTWQVLIEGLGADMATYSSLRLGLYPSPQQIPLWYDWYGTPLLWLTQHTGSDVSIKDCYSWSPSANLIIGDSCGNDKHVLCSKPKIQYAGTNSSCPSSVFVELNGKCFWLSPTFTKNIEAAMVFCSTEYGTMATFYNQTEMNVIRTAFLNTNVTISDVWLAVTTKENVMHRLYGESITWSNLRPKDFDDTRELCTIMHREKKVWHTEHCDHTEAAICQGELQNSSACIGKIIGDLCYWVSLDRYEGVYGAQEFCESQNGTLAIPSNVYIDVKLQEYSFNKSLHERFWLGATRFLWLTFTGDRLTRLNWRDTEIEPGDDNCVVLRTKNFNLDDESCIYSVVNKTIPGLCSKEVRNGSACLGVLYRNTTCYWLSTSTNSPSAAHVDCTVNGGFLAAILSDDVNEYLEHNYSELQHHSKVWLGITIHRRNWYTKNAEQKWFNWHHQENPFSTEEDCVTFSASDDFKWSTVAGCPVVEIGSCQNEQPQPGNMCMKEFVESTTEPTQPVTAQSESTQQATTQPSTTQQATMQPTSTKPATTQPATTQPATTQQATAQPATTTTQPVTTQPATTQPATTQQATTQPATTTTQPVTTQFDSTQPVTTQPESTQQATMQQATTQPETTQPATAQPESAQTTQPAITEPTQPESTQTTQPATTQPESTQQAITPPISTLSSLIQGKGTTIGQGTTIEQGITGNKPEKKKTGYIKLCGCKKRSPNLNVNITNIMERLQQDIRKKLIVPLDKISAVINKKISIPDNRPSSTGIGVIFIAVIVVILSSIIFMDSINIFLVQRIKGNTLLI